MKLQTKDLFYIIILFALFFFTRSNKEMLEINTTTTDTIYRTITLKQIDTLIITKTPKPIKVKDVDVSMYTDSIQLLNALIDLSKTRTYKKVYDDSLYSAEVTNIVKGELKESRFKLVLKPRNIQIKETHITTEKFPKYSLYYGLKATLPSTISPRPNLEGSFGYQSRKGNIWSIGINTDKQISVGFKKRFLTKY